jgi:hypothetical protein
VFNAFIVRGQLITGKVIDANDGKPIFNATVQLLDPQEKTLLYVVTDEKGAFEFNYKGLLSKLRIKISYFGYEKYQKELQKPFPKDLLIKLEEKVNKLNEVVVKSDFKEFRVKKDTIAYNLKALRDSTEVNLEDLVKKLPGLEINENGKIQYQNKEIDKVTIDGNEFFGNKHQIATKNLPANAVEGIELLTNHQDFESIKGFDNKGKIVLNVKLKENYKNRIVGNIEANYGAIDKYLGHLNLFNFFKQGNLSVVSDYNNVGETAITIDDYIELRGGINAFTDGSQSSIIKIDDSNLPSYVIANNQAEKREVGFTSLNYTQTFSNKLKFVGYSILNDSKLLENQFSEKSFFDASQINLQESIRNESDNFLSSTYANLTYKPSDVTSWKYQFNFNATNDDREETILNTDPLFNSFDNVIENESFSIGNSLEFRKKLSDKWLLSSNVVQNYTSSENELRLNSDQEFLGLAFNSSDFNLRQTQDLKNSNVSWNAIFNNDKSDNQEYEFATEFVHQNTLFDSQVDEFSGFDNDLKRTINQFGVSIRGNSTVNKNIKVGYGLRNNFYQVTQNNTQNTLYRLLPSVSLSYSFLQGQRIVLNYDQNIDFIGIQDIIENRFVENFRSVIGLSALDLNDPIDKEKFGITYSNINPKKNLFLTSSFTYEIENNAIGYDITYDQTFINETSIRIPRKEHYFGILSLTKRFKKTPLKLRSTVYYDLIKTENSVEGARNRTDIEQLALKLEMQSAFKNKAFQFVLGVDHRRTNFSQEFNDLNSRLRNLNPYAEVRGIIGKRLLWKLETRYEQQTTNDESNRFYMVNPNLQYTFKNEKLQLHIKGFNVLNLSDNQLLSQSLNESFFQTNRIELLRGYVLFGFRYNF